VDGDYAAALLEAAPVGLLVVDEVGTITYASASVEELTGYGYDDVVGTNILSYLHETAVQGMIESVAYVQEYKDAVMGPASLGFVHRDGAVRVLEVYATNHYDDPVLGGLVVAVRDQTFQYQINDALRAYTEGTQLAPALATLCDALIGLPIRGKAAIVDPASGRPLANARLPESVFGPAPAGARPRPWQEAVATKEPVLPLTLADHDEELRAAVEDEGMTTMWAVPVLPPVSADDVQATACLLIGRHEVGAPSLNERLTIATAARTAAMLLEREYLVAELSRTAHTDPLTGLANRAQLFRARDGRPGAAGDAAAAPLPVGVLYVDLDGFKPVNDAHGHAVGDRVLFEVGRRLEACCRRGDELGRIGGDEFVVLCWGLDDEGEATRIADRIVAAMRTPVTVDVQADGPPVEVQIGASVGVALSPGVTRQAAGPPSTAVPASDPGRRSVRGADEHDGGAAGESLDDVMQRADAALYEAKRNGRNRWTVAATTGDGV